MSSWFSQNLVYGYKTDFTTFKAMVNEEDTDKYDDAMAENRDDGFGWIVSDNFVVYGKILLSGESNGNDSVFAGESGIIQLKLPSQSTLHDYKDKIYEKFNHLNAENIPVHMYITGDWN